LNALTDDPDLYTRLEEFGAELEAGLRAAAARAGVPAVVNRVGSLLCLYFTADPVKSWDEARTADTRRYAAYFQHMLGQGSIRAVVLEAAFLSAPTLRRHRAHAHRGRGGTGRAAMNRPALNSIPGFGPGAHAPRRLQRACRCIPIWPMRQAGRYLPNMRARAQPRSRPW
jgi:hypothetical protein